MNYRHYLFLLLLLGLGVIIYIAGDNSISTPLLSRVTSTPAGTPDVFMENARITQYDEAGNRSSFATATQVVHYPDSDTTWLDSPDIWNWQDSINPPWHSVSERGKLLPGGKTLELYDNVVINRANPKGGAPLQLETDFLTIHTDRDIAETERPVRISDESGVTTAVGMTTYYKENLVKLKSKVRGIHEVKQPTP
ncbi:LPS export ABC transporter periplasmic protein LptC [Endozoicomonadaceae bacterium StTr2]